MKIRFLKHDPIEVISDDGFAPIVKIVSEKFQYVPNILSESKDIFTKTNVEIEYTPLEIDKNIEPIPDVFDYKDLWISPEAMKSIKEWNESEPSDTVPVLLSPGFTTQEISPALKYILNKVYGNHFVK